MSYAFVQDVPASWEQYEQFAAAVAAEPSGLILHVAGPTDEGFRIIEVWETEAAWERFSAGRAQEAAAPREPFRQTVFRALRPMHVVWGRRHEDEARLDA